MQLHFKAKIDTPYFNHKEFSEFINSIHIVNLEFETYQNEKLFLDDNCY